MDYIGVFGTFGRKTLAIMLICIGDGIRDSLFYNTQGSVYLTEKMTWRFCFLLSMPIRILSGLGNL